MFTNVKPHGKNIQVRCRTNLPWSWRIHVQVQNIIITFRDREGSSLWFSELWGTLQTLALSRGCALLVRTLWAHMLRQDKKFKIKSIMKHKTFKLDIIDSCINYMMLTCFDKITWCFKCFVRLCLYLLGESSSVYIPYCR